MPKYLCLHRSVGGGNAERPSPAKMQEMYAQFGAWQLACAFERARALGLSADADLTALLRDGLPSSDLPP